MPIRRHLAWSFRVGAFPLAVALAAGCRGDRDVNRQVTLPAVFGPIELSDAGRAAEAPQALTPVEIGRAMRSAASRAKDCYSRFNVPGMVLVAITVEPGGQVAEAKAVGRFANTPTGKCVAAAVKTATFSPFGGPAVKFEYSFVLGLNAK